MKGILILIRIYNFLKKHYPIILVIVFALLICLNVLVYYQYVYLVMNMQTKPIIEKTSINQEILGKVLNDIDNREEALHRIKTTQYYSPFDN